MAWWDARAARLQQGVRHDESEQSIRFSEHDTARAIVHTREDVVMLVSYLSSVNRQLATVRLAVVVMAAALIYLCIVLARHGMTAW